MDINQIFKVLLAPYEGYTSTAIFLEVVAVFFGLLSVWYAKKNKIAVYPTGMLSTAIFVYLLLKAGLLGDMMINAYYFIMSVYGWYFWTRSREDVPQHPIGWTTVIEQKWSVFIFFATLIFVSGVYHFYERLNHWTAYVDTVTTAIFFVGMWLMARRKIEHWIFWLVGDLISIPLYLYKGLALTSFQYLIFTLIAIFGYRSWKKYCNSPQAIV